MQNAELTNYNSARNHPPSILIPCETCGNLNCLHGRRMNRRGEGAWYAKQIKSLQPIHRIVLEILTEMCGFDSESAVNLHDLWPRVADACKRMGSKIPTKQGLSGRVSELVGLGFAKKVWVEVEVYDRRTQEYRYPRRPATYLARCEERPRRELLAQQELFL